MSKVDTLLKNIIKVFLFLSSYIPLFMILIFQNMDNKSVAVFYMMLIVISLVILAMYCENYARIRKDTKITVKDIRNNGVENLGYMSGYVIPFVSINTAIIVDGKFSIQNIATLIILFSVLGYLYIKSNLYYVNPVLNLFYDIDTITTKEVGDIILIRDKSDKFKVGNSLNVAYAIDNIYFVNNKKNIVRKMIAIAIMLGIIFSIIIFYDEIKNIVFIVIEQIANKPS